jgi:SAM-dependent methyltransferase/GNAT superfamily N-acetyltransferase
MAESYQFRMMPGGVASDALLEECSNLYSTHYGVWGEGSPKQGRPIKLGAALLREWVSGGDTTIYLARWRTTLVGYAIVLQTREKDFGVVSWVTQFIVHRDHRAKGIGKRLLFAAWGMSNHEAWGIVTSNPYAVRALEKATRRRCVPERIRRNRRKLASIGATKISYLNEHTVYVVDREASRVDTAFMVDHSSLDEKLRNASGPGKEWLLGLLPAGWEWFAFCFTDQPQIQLTRAEVDAMLAASDEVTREAYSRMQVESQPWAKKTTYEVDVAAEYLQLVRGQSVVDFGCGIGRHVVAFADKGFNAVGVDYSESLIDKARDNIREKRIDAKVWLGDCRSIDFGRRFDGAVCLYDVVGSYIDEQSNLKLLTNLFEHLNPGARALISVMNGELTRAITKNRFTLHENPDALLSLPASDVMQATGNVFDPDFFIVEEATGAVYRKERFDLGQQLPVEMIVRDRRFDSKEVVALCERAGFNVLWVRPVRVGDWQRELDVLDERAKEILLLCKRPSD